MIAKDEEGTIGRALVSARALVDELIVVDTGSSDGTRREAARAGAKVTCTPWCDDFSRARNHALELVTGDYALVLDADEEVSPEVSPRDVRAALSSGALAFAACVQSLLPSGELTRYRRTMQIRVVRRDPRLRYEGAIHEELGPSVRRAGGSIEPAPLTIVHHGYQRQTAQGESRLARNARLLAAELERRPGDAVLRFHAGMTARLRGELLGARAHLRAALALDDEWAALGSRMRARAHVALAQLALAEHDDRAALRHAQAAVAAEPADVVAWHVVGLAAIGTGAFALAADALGRVRQDDATDPARHGELDALIAFARGRARAPASTEGESRSG